MEAHTSRLTKKFTLPLLGLFLLISELLAAQISETDSLAMTKVITDFKEAIAQKDSIRFDCLFFSETVNFTGIMSKETEWSIKKDYPDFQGISVSNHKNFIHDICKTPKKQEERIYNVILVCDVVIGSISFDYAFFSDGKVFQWGKEKWNLAKDGENWLITDVVFSIHFPDIEPLPFE